MKAQNQLTKKILKVIFVGIFMSLPVQIEPVGFGSPFTQDVEIFMNSQFDHQETLFLKDQKNLFLELVAEVSRHPDLLESLPFELRREIELWQKQGKSL